MLNADRTEKIARGAGRESEAQDAGDAANGAKRKIQSVERAIGILEVLANVGEDVRLNDLAKALGLNVSTCHHLTNTLLEHGFVGQSAQSRGYFLGNRILELADRRMRRFDLADAAMPYMRALNDATGETVHLAAMRGDELITVGKLDSHHAVRADGGFGNKTGALHATATGKAILAWLPEPELDRIVSRNGMRRFTDHTITDRAQLIEDLRHVRRNGFAVDNEEYQPGVICIGAAIRNHLGTVIGSFSCSMPTMRADESHLHAVEGEVRQAALAITQSLGGGEAKPE